MSETRKLEVELPEEILSCFESPKEAEDKAKQGVVLDLLRGGKISQGKAAELLGISRWELFDLMAKYHIPFTDLPPEELEEGLRNLREALNR